MTIQDPISDRASTLVLVRLRPGADRAAYERWATTTDGPTVLSRCDGIEDWRLYRVDGDHPDGPAPGFDYIEVVAGSSRYSIDAAMSSPVVAGLVREARRFIEEPVTLPASRLS